jgi:hypothetical protein
VPLVPFLPEEAAAAKEAIDPASDAVCPEGEEAAQGEVRLGCRGIGGGLTGPECGELGTVAGAASPLEQYRIIIRDGGDGSRNGPMIVVVAAVGGKQPTV